MIVVKLGAELQSGDKIYGDDGRSHIIASIQPCEGPHARLACFGDEGDCFVIFDSDDYFVEP